jgi:serine/threonine protein kinase
VSLNPKLPKIPRRGFSRVDTLPDGFLQVLEKKPLAPGDVIGERYQLIEKLGDGAMGQVFVAENQGIGKRVAVKVLRHELLQDSEFRQRFQREAEAIAAIEHRNVARFLDLVVGNPTFLVMEYVRGPTLKARLAQRGRIPVREAVTIAWRLCWALEAVHECGLVHRDLKPDNVILSPDAELGEVPKLIDFGLAKRSGAKNTAELSRNGQILGTPEYMPPEQVSGKSLDARTDVYALGCMLYQMITGALPFGGTDDVQVLFQQLHGAAKPLAQLEPTATPALQKIVDRALAKDPAQRFASMREMAEALKRAGEISPSSGKAPPPSGTRRALFAGSLALNALLFAGLLLIKRAEPAGSGVLVLSQPSGVAVEIDGKRLPEPTPTAARGLAPGEHVVRLVREKSPAVERRVLVQKGENAVVEINLPPATHRLEVRSVPDRATIYLDGHLQPGATPTTIDVSDDGFHELRLEKPGFEPLRRALAPEDNAPTMLVTLQPERAPHATLLVDSEPVGAEVLIDGIDSGFTTPTIDLIVPTGTHEISVAAGEKRASKSLHVTAGDHVRLRLDPK